MNFFRNRQIPTEVDDALDRDRPVEAIRIWRAHNDFCGLAEAKEFIEAYRASRQPKPKQAPMAEQTLPKQELLIKLLSMTTSSNDGEALVALRKASALMTSAGWDWRRLIEGKITVVADPFASVSAPPPQRETNSENMSTPGRPRPAYTRPAPPPPRPRPAPPPPPMPNSPLSGLRPAGTQTGRWSSSQGPTQQAPKNHSTKPNRYDGWCYCCGLQLDAQKHFVFNPYSVNPNAADKWTMICSTCNQSGHVPASPAPRQKAKAQPLGSLPNSALHSL